MLTKIKKITKTFTNAGALIDALEGLGVDSIFGYPGASVLSIYNELSKSNAIKHYLVRHEQSAIHAAEGYARVSGKVGVVLVTSGPGFTNTVTGIADAYADSTPLVVLAGCVPDNIKSDKIFQNVEISEIAKTCAKETIILKGNDDIKKVIEHAFTTANSGVKGPVVVGLPRNILEAEYSEKCLKHSGVKTEILNLSREVDIVINKVKLSKKPLILIGGGCIDAHEEVINFAKNLNVPVVSTLMGIGVIPTDNENYLGMIGINGTYPANSAINEADLLIALGVSFSDRSTCKNNNYALEKDIISVNIVLSKDDIKLQIKADVKKFLTQFNNNYKNSINIKQEWLNRVKTLKNENIIISNDSKYLQSSNVLETISEFMQKYNPVVVTDVGQHQMTTAQYFTFREPRKFLTSGGMGTMGFGLPAAIGAYIADNNNLVLNITGDGSYQMNLQELATCREHNIPIKIIIMNNSSLGMVRQLQEKIYNKQYQVKMTNPDFVKIAEAYDLFAIRVKKQNELIPALEQLIKHNGTAILDVQINSHEEI